MVVNRGRYKQCHRFTAASSSSNSHYRQIPRRKTASKCRFILASKLQPLHSTTNTNAFGFRVRSGVQSGPNSSLMTGRTFAKFKLLNHTPNSGYNINQIGSRAAATAAGHAVIIIIIITWLLGITDCELWATITVLILLRAVSRFLKY